MASLVLSASNVQSQLHRTFWTEIITGTVLQERTDSCIKAKATLAVINEAAFQGHFDHYTHSGILHFVHNVITCEGYET